MNVRAVTTRSLAAYSLAALLLSAPLLPGQSATPAASSVEEQLAALSNAIAHAPTPAERARLVRQYTTLEAPAEAPPASDMEPLMRATALFLRPFQERSAHYTEAAGKFLSGQALKAAFLLSKDGIADLKQQVRALAAENAAIAGEVEELIPNVQQAIGGIRATPLARRSFIEGLNQSLFRQRDSMLAIRRTEAALWTQLLELYDLLEATRGQWSFDPTGQIRFTDPTSGARFATMLQSLPIFGGAAAAPVTTPAPQRNSDPVPPPTAGPGGSSSAKSGGKVAPSTTPTPKPTPPPDS